MVKRKKNPDAPRGAMGAYMFFCKSQRQRVKDENPGIDVRQILSELGKRWSALSERDKIPFKRMAEQDKMRFETEKEIYLQTHDSMYQELTEKKRRKKKKKDPNAPKKNRSSYILFVADHRQQAIAELPEGARQVEIMSRVAKMWREADEDVKHKYTTMAQAEKEEYDQKMAIYNQRLALMQQQNLQAEVGHGMDGY